LATTVTPETLQFPFGEVMFRDDVSDANHAVSSASLSLSKLFKADSVPVASTDGKTDLSAGNPFRLIMDFGLQFRQALATKTKSFLMHGDGHIGNFMGSLAANGEAASLTLIDRRNTKMEDPHLELAKLFFGTLDREIDLQKLQFADITHESGLPLMKFAPWTANETRGTRVSRFAGDADKEDKTMGSQMNGEKEALTRFHDKIAGSFSTVFALELASDPMMELRLRYLTLAQNLADLGAGVSTLQPAIKDYNATLNEKAARDIQKQGWRIMSDYVLAAQKVREFCQYLSEKIDAGEELFQQFAPWLTKAQNGTNAMHMPWDNIVNEYNAWR